MNSNRCFKADSTLLVPYDESVPDLGLGAVSGEGAADGERSEDGSVAASEGKKKKKKKVGCGGAEGQEGDGDGGPAQIFKSTLYSDFF
jgi:hypothetical protein